MNWSWIDKLVDVSADLAGLDSHGLDLYAADRWRRTGRLVPNPFLEHERVAAMAVLAVPTLLSRIREVVDGPILVMKGPEVATRYPDPSLRPFRDLDLLVHDAESAHRSLVSAGWVEIRSARPHHPPELLLPGSMLSIEIHPRPNWPWWTTADTHELFAHAVPSALGVDGVQTLSPAHHAVVLAAHSWQHEPIRRLVDLIDVALMIQDVDDMNPDDVAERWSLGPVWQVTNHTIDVLMHGDTTASLTTRLMARHCRQARERTVFERRLSYLAGGMWAPTPSVIAAATTARLIRTVLPMVPHSWASEVFQRSRRTFGERL